MARQKEMFAGPARVAIALMVAAACGCTTVETAHNYRTLLPSMGRCRDAAKEANQQGLTFAADDDYEQAEKAFRQALRADVTYAPAHNNLGLVLLAQGRFHDSALELSFAKRLNPQATEPLINLARLYERVGWWPAAIAEYEQALALDEDNVEAMGRLARAYAQTRRNPTTLESLLRKLVLGKDNEGWKTWALAQLSPQASAAAK